MADTQRCSCRRKLALTDFPCGKCKVRFCRLHRLPEEHDCTHDFKKEGKETLTKQLVQVVASKIDTI